MSLIVRQIEARSHRMNDGDLASDVRFRIVDENVRAEPARRRLEADSYTCPFCSFTAGVRLSRVHEPKDTSIVRCLSCGQSSEFLAPADPRRQTR